jgi:futalosine hydrolase
VPDDVHVLLVAATAAELAGRPGLACGIGPVEAAAATARALVTERPAAVLHVGIAGGRDLPIGTVVVGAEARYLDLAAGIPVVSSVEPDPALLEAVTGALQVAVPGAVTAAIGTSAAVGASDRVSQAPPVEAMEGFGVLRACALAGVPVVEVRVVSNAIGEEDRGLWDITGALARLEDVVPVALAAVERTVGR